MTLSNNQQHLFFTVICNNECVHVISSYLVIKVTTCVCHAEVMSQFMHKHFHSITCIDPSSKVHINMRHSAFMIPTKESITTYPTQSFPVTRFTGFRRQHIHTMLVILKLDT